MHAAERLLVAGVTCIHARLLAVHRPLSTVLPHQVPHLLPLVLHDALLCEGLHSISLPIAWLGTC